jgi:hypothetical protein
VSRHGAALESAIVMQRLIEIIIKPPGKKKGCSNKDNTRCFLYTLFAEHSLRHSGGGTDDDWEMAADCHFCLLLGVSLTNKA